MAKPEKPAANASRRTALLAIARELGGKAVETEVALAIDRPTAYRERFGDTYETIEDATAAEVPWLGMIECMTERDAIAESDWKEAASDVLWKLETIGGAAAKRALKAAHEPELDERYTEEAIALFARQLGAAKLALIELDKMSDSYVLAIVAPARVAPLARLARTAGERIIHHTGKDLEKIEAARHRKEGKRTSQNAWVALCARYDFRRTGSAADSVLWGLHHGDPTLDEIRAVAPFAPKRDQPLIAMTLALYDGAPSNLAKTTKQPELMLAALRYVNVAAPERRYERLAAAMTLADRLKIQPDRSKRHEAVCDACNVWNYGKETDAQLARLPAATRDRLARFADGMLVRASEGTDRWHSAFRMLSVCGDAASLPAMAEAGKRAMADREKHDYDLSGPYAWEDAAAHIERRIKAAKRPGSSRGRRRRP